MKYLDLPAALHNLVSTAFTAAKRSESLSFSSTELATIHTRHGVPFQLRYCPALAKKPKAQPTDSGNATPTKKPDPFENPPPELLVAELPRTDPSHILVLNKYPVIPNHFILATKISKQQTDVLEEDDLDITFACLSTWKGSNNIARDSSVNSYPRKLFAFFNSGEHSGASQAHRHLQFLPYEDMIGPSSEEVEWQLLVDRMTEPCGDEQDKDLLHNSSLPFCHYALRIPPSPSSSLLHRVYLRLYHAAVEAVRRSEPGSGSSSSSSSSIQSKDPSAATISYNLAMTEDVMAICPRRNEAAIVPASNVEGSVAINGTILAGTLMVKDQGEWESLRRDPDLLSHVLATIGFPAEGGRDGQAGNKL